MKICNLINVFSATAALLAGTAYTMGAPRYALTDLGVAAQWPTAISSDGSVVGNTNSYVTRAFVWQNGNLNTLNAPNGTDKTYGTAINAAGKVVGGYGVASNQYPCVWLNGQPYALPGGAGQAWDVNINGTVAGTSGNRAAVWNASNELSFIGTSTSTGQAINATGQVAGSQRAGSFWHAFQYTSGELRDLGTIGGPTYAWSYGQDIDSAGRVVGYCSTVSDGKRPFLWDPTHGMVDIGTLPGSPYGQAIGISPDGHTIVGSSYGSSGWATAWINGAAYDLNTCTTVPTGWRLNTAMAANDAGQIAGYMYLNGNQTTPHGFLLTPIPEPATLSLLAVGCAALLQRRRGYRRINVP